MLESKADGRLGHTVAEGMEWWRSGGFRRTHSQGLCRIAPHGRQIHAAGKPGNTLQATALVHEVFLKLVDANDVDWKDKAHFFAPISPLPSKSPFAR
jgi:hypothetical protein